MAKPADLTTEARAGFEGKPNPYIYSSPAWYAHALGQWFQRTGRPVPADVRMSRGSRVRVGDTVYSVVAEFLSAGAASFERVQ